MNNFKNWLKEQAALIEAAQGEGFSKGEAIELLKIYRLEGIADSIEDIGSAISSMD
jgi:uncharacterized protein Yka (UPF0111/DUF47 family)